MLMSDSYFENLNPEQRDAVLSVGGPMAVLAGAGSGKTRVLTSKVFNMIDNHSVDPSSIMMVTFTNKAAKEMNARVGRPLGFIGTFHSFGARVLRENAMSVDLNPGFVIFDTSDKEEIIKKIVEAEFGKSKNPTSYYANKISQAKDALIDYKEYYEFAGTGSGHDIAVIYDKYTKRMKANNAVDFDDLIFLTVKLLQRNQDILSKYWKKFAYFLIDEFQDTNVAQFELTKLLSKNSKNITVVGDFAQSIYSWRGADITNLTKFMKEHTDIKTIYLERNYRSTAQILDFAYDVISQNELHPILRLHTDKEAGAEVEILELENEESEAFFVVEIAKQAQEVGKTMAILYRINAQSRIIEEALLKQGIAYKLVGGTRFYERKEVKDLLCFLRLIVNPLEEVSLRRIQKVGKRKWQAFENWRSHHEMESTNWWEEMSTTELLDGVNGSSGYLNEFDSDKPEEQARLENVKELRSVALNFPILSEFLEQVALVESEYSANEKKGTAQDAVVTLMTVHQAKGLEFEYVIVVGVEEGIMPHSRSLEEKSALEEERRLFYVAITRAMEKLYITFTQKRFFFGRRTYAEPSRFIKSKLSGSRTGGGDEIVYF